MTKTKAPRFRAEIEKRKPLPSHQAAMLRKKPMGSLRDSMRK